MENEDLNKIENGIYTFQDWIDGKEEPKEILDKDVSYSIYYNQKVAFESALKIDLRFKKHFLNEKLLDKMDGFDRNEFLSLELKKTQEYYDSLDIDKQFIILKDFSPHLITAKNCHFIEIGLNNGLGIDLSFLKDNLIFQGRSTYQYLKYLNSLIVKYKVSSTEIKQLNKTNRIPKDQAEFKSLKQLFKEKFKSDNDYNDLMKRLFNENLLAEDFTTWIGKKEHGKIQLASLIKYLGQKYLNKTLREDHIIFISETDFKNKVSKGTVKKANADFAEYYFI